MKCSFFTIKRKTITSVSAFIIFLVISYLWLTSPLPPPNSDVLSDSRYYIAHASGAIDGKTYLNCEEALLQSLDNGYKYVELDLGMTSDSILVCIHDWRAFRKYTKDSISSNGNQALPLEEFIQKRILGKYTPLTLEKTIEISHSHPFTIVTDKISKAETLNRYFSQSRDQVMVEAFKLSDYHDLKHEGYVPMMSLWSLNYLTLLAVFTYYPLRYQEKIDWICVHSSSNMNCLRIVKRLFHCKVAMYTSNSPSFFKEHLGREIDLIYTDNWNTKTKTNNDSVNTSTY